MQSACTECSQSPHASVRAGAAEVIATSAQNHDRVQGEMLAAGVMGVLVSLFGDEDPVVVAKALLAVGSLVRGNDAGVAAFKAAQGPTELWGLLGHQVRASERGLSRITLHQSPCPTAETALGRCRMCGCGGRHCRFCRGC